MWKNRTLLYTRPHLLELMSSSDIIVSNVVFQDSPFWNIHPVYCRWDEQFFLPTSDQNLPTLTCSLFLMNSAYKEENHWTTHGFSRDDTLPSCCHFCSPDAFSSFAHIVGSIIRCHLQYSFNRRTTWALIHLHHHRLHKNYRLGVLSCHHKSKTTQTVRCNQWTMTEVQKLPDNIPNKSQHTDVGSACFLAAVSSKCVLVVQNLLLLLSQAPSWEINAGLSFLCAAMLWSETWLS